MLETLFECNYFKLKHSKTMLHKHITAVSMERASLRTEDKNVYLLNLEKRHESKLFTC